jgi:hypothetical protein
LISRSRRYAVHGDVPTRNPSATERLTGDIPAAWTQNWRPRLERGLVKGAG